MDTREKEHIAALINFFWGPNTAQPHSITEKVAAVAYEILEEAQRCSAAMGLIPRLAGAPRANIQRVIRVQRCLSSLHANKRNLTIKARQAPPCTSQRPWSGRGSACPSPWLGLGGLTPGMLQVEIGKLR